MRNNILTLALLGGLAPLAGCGGNESFSRSPTAPSAGPTTSAGLHIAAINPNAVSNLGASGKISGTGFAPGVKVEFGGVAPYRIWLLDDHTIQFETTTHVSETVDVVVRNPGGSQDTLRQGLTFAPPESFDFNGSWVGYGGDDYGTEMAFVIENNALTRVSCGASLVWTFTAPSPIARGEFHAASDNGLQISGYIVSATSATGEINIAPCAKVWWAVKR